MLDEGSFIRLDGRMLLSSSLPVRAALDLAAKALAEGQGIPREAQELLAKPVIPYWLYRLLGDWGWKQASKGFGARKLLQARPYQTGAK